MVNSEWDAMLDYDARRVLVRTYRDVSSYGERVGDGSCDEHGRDNYDSGSSVAEHVLLQNRFSTRMLLLLRRSIFLVKPSNASVVLALHSPLVWSDQILYRSIVTVTLRPFH